MISKIFNHDFFISSSSDGISEMKQITIILLIILITSCTRQIIINDINTNSEGLFQFGKTPERDFYVDTDLPDSLIFEKKYSVSGSFNNSSMVFYDEYAFAGDLSGNIYAINLDTKKITGTQNNKGGVFVCPIINKLRLFYVTDNLDSRNSTFYMYDFYLNIYHAKIEIPGSCRNEMVKTNDAIFLLSSDGTLYKISLMGEIIWIRKTNATTYCNPAADESNIYWGNSSGQVIKVSLNDGSILGVTKQYTAIESGITIRDGLIYMGDNAGNLSCFNTDLQKIWEYQTSAKIISNPAVSDSIIIFGNLEGNIYCLDRKFGKLIWILKTGGIINTTPIIFKNITVVADLNKKIHFIENEDGKLEKQIELEGRCKLSPSFFKGSLFISYDRGNLLELKYE